MCNNNVDSEIRVINKALDDIVYRDFVSDAENIKIHLFSNIIDVDRFDIQKLYSLIIESFSGVNRMICSSPDNLRKKRIDDFCDLFSDSYSVRKEVKANEPIYGEVYYVARGSYEQRRIGRYERQFTVEL